MSLSATRFGNIIANFVDQRVGVEFVINGYSPGTGLAAPIFAGSQGFLDIPFNCQLTGVQLYADQTGTIDIDVRKATYAGLFTVASIVGTPYGLVGARKYRDTVLSGWQNTFLAGDVLEFVVNSTNGVITRITCTLTVKRSALNPQITANLHWRGTWSAVVSYVINDIVFYNGSAYIAIADSLNDTPPGTSWELLVQQGAAGAGSTPDVVLAESYIDAMGMFQ